MDNKTKIVIVGGGFGGVYTAKYLQKFFRSCDAEVTLINKTNYFLFTPLLHEVATGGLSPESIVEPIREVFRGTCVNIVDDTVIEIDRSLKKVLTSSRTFDYDYLVISNGADTNYFNTPGAREHTFSLKNLQDAIAIRNHVINTCEQAVSTKNKDLLTVSVIGAGATGVELAAELREYMEHTLCNYYKFSGFKKEDINVNVITATPDIISMFPEKMRHISEKELKRKGIKILANTIVTKVEPGILNFKDNSTLKSHTIIWVAGVVPTLSEIKGIEVGPKGRLEVNEFLQSIKDPQIFGIGDTAGTFPMLAQVAKKQAKVVAENIYSLIKNDELTPFNFKQDILLISIGQWYAIGHFWKITLRGPLMWLLWRAVYLFNFISLRKKFEIMIEWIINFFYPRDITYIK
jgi:NADH:ubiquinone reductase (H+-translocating)